MRSPLDTHDVTNQSVPLEGHDVFGTDAALAEAATRHGAAWAVEDLRELGELAGSAEWQEWGRRAERNPPELRTHDRYGHRLDVVDYHPAYHGLMETAIAHGLHAGPWADDRRGAHVARAAKVIVWYQVDSGHVCPISMTYSGVPALRHEPDVAAEWESRLTSPHYDPSNRPAADKAGATCGMAMTEKQGGSDVRANTTTARSDGSGDHLLTGHKWFCSAPMSDVFLMLAQAPEGLTCFAVPRWRPDGTRNPIRIQRLKDKLGDRSNASSEIEMADVWGRRVGDEGRGVRTIIEMVNHTRLDCILGSTSIMRRGTAEASWHARHRSAFGAVLDDQPLMVNVLADLALESEAATLAAMRLAQAFDAPADDAHEQLVKRLVTPVIKYWTCKRAPMHAAEALECLGGAGYVEESGMPRLFRQSPLNGVWEGSGNVMCLDVLRALAKAPESLDAYWREVATEMSGLLALLDDVAAIAKIAAAQLDDVAAQASKAGAKAAGVVIDDAAVTPKYVAGLPAARELPIVLRIARASLFNKLVILLPLALLLDAFLPWMLTPLLMLGGGYLCYEGAEKIWHAFGPREAHESAALKAQKEQARPPLDAAHLEERRVKGAIKTDFILSAEIMTISLAAIETDSVLSAAVALIAVAVGITVLVYGAVALLVKADDAGLKLTQVGRLSATRALGRAIVRHMPQVMTLIATVGTAAMLWVGGNIIVHGLHVLGWHGPYDIIHGLALGAASLSAAAAAAIEWIVTAALDGMVGLALGLVLVLVIGGVIRPLLGRAKGAGE